MWQSAYVVITPYVCWDTKHFYCLTTEWGEIEIFINLKHKCGWTSFCLNVSHSAWCARSLKARLINTLTQIVCELPEESASGPQVLVIALGDMMLIVTEQQTQASFMWVTQLIETNGCLEHKKVNYSSKYLICSKWTENAERKKNTTSTDLVMKCKL